jgi:hypothetical protein
MATPNISAALPRPATREKSRAWWVMVVLSIAVAGYAAAYVVIGAPLYPPNLRESFVARPWGIYPHAFFGMLALAVGPFQFHRGLLVRRRALHRRLGTLYAIAAFLTGCVGFYMSFYSAGGMVTHVGFGLLGILTAGSTAMAYVRIRQNQIRPHREWMVRSFALLFAAVTLRIQLPLLIIAAQGDFDPAYRIVSWLSWVPNLLWAEWYLRRSRPQSLPATILGLRVN